MRGPQPIDAGGDRRTDGRTVVDAADVHTFQILFQPIMIESNGTHQIRGTGEGDEADAIVGPFLDELRDHRFDHVDAIDPLIVDQEIQRLHRAGHVQTQHDVDPIGGDLRAAVPALRARESHDHESCG